MLFMGEEWGAGTPWQFFTSHPEPELAAATAEGRLREFEQMGWDPAIVPDPQAEKTFTDSRLDWTEPDTGDHARLLSLYGELIATRKRLPGLADPRFAAIDVDYDAARRGLLIRRPGALVAANLSGDEHAVRLAPAAADAAAAPDSALPNRALVDEVDDGSRPRIELATTDGFRLSDTEVVLPAWSAAVLSVPPVGGIG